MRIDDFRFIDKINILADDKLSLEATTHVPQQHRVFECHFPTFPILPGVYLIETMNQAAGFLILAKTDFAAMPFFCKATKANMRTFVSPGEILTVTAHLEHEGSGYAVAKAAITANGKKICEAELMFRIMPFEGEELRTLMKKEAQEMGLLTHKSPS